MRHRQAGCRTKMTASGRGGDLTESTEEQLMRQSGTEKTPRAFSEGVTVLLHASIKCRK